MKLESPAAPTPAAVGSLGTPRNLNTAFDKALAVSQARTTQDLFKETSTDASGKEWPEFLSDADLKKLEAGQAAAMQARVAEHHKELQEQHRDKLHRMTQDAQAWVHSTAAAAKPLNAAQEQQAKAVLEAAIKQRIKEQAKVGNASPDGPKEAQSKAIQDVNQAQLKAVQQRAQQQAQEQAVQQRLQQQAQEQAVQQRLQQQAQEQAMQQRMQQEAQEQAIQQRMQQQAQEQAIQQRMQQQAQEQAMLEQQRLQQQAHEQAMLEQQRVQQQAQEQAMLEQQRLQQQAHQQAMEQQRVQQQAHEQAMQQQMQEHVLLMKQIDQEQEACMDKLGRLVRMKKELEE